MRIRRLHAEGTTTPGLGEPFHPKTSLVSLVAQVGGESGSAVSATMSVLGEVNGFDPSPIEFGGSSIISLSGTTSAQWEGQIAGNGYETIHLQLLSLSTLASFKAAATEAEA